MRARAYLSSVRFLSPLHVIACPQLYMCKWCCGGDGDAWPIIIRINFKNYCVVLVPVLRPDPKSECTCTRTS